METLAPNGQPSSGTKSYSPGALAHSGVINAKKGVLHRISMLNTNAAARYLQLFDAAAVPADAAVPLMSIPIPIGGWVNVDFGVYGKSFGVGICWSTSSTAATKTVGAADALVEASYLGQQA